LLSRTYLPVPQSWHAGVPGVFVYFPAMHEEQPVREPASESDPDGQSKHAMFPSPLDVLPARHSSHSDAMGAAAYLPCWHESHCIEPASAYC
jgi:hypothetical protein